MTDAGAQSQLSQWAMAASPARSAAAPLAPVRKWGLDSFARPWLIRTPKAAARLNDGSVRDYRPRQAASAVVPDKSEIKM